MVFTYLVISMVCVAALVACSTTQPAGDRNPERSTARRRRFVTQNPTHVTTEDVRRQLVREGVSPEQAELITAKAAEHGVRPFTMWLWMQRSGAQSLGIVVGADLSHRDLLTHISNGTVPDLEELALFASANGVTFPAQPVRQPGRKVLVDSGLGTPERPPLPPIHDPSGRTGVPRTERTGPRGDDGLAA